MERKLSLQAHGFCASCRRKTARPRRRSQAKLIAGCIAVLLSACGTPAKESSPPAAQGIDMATPVDTARTTPGRPSTTAGSSDLLPSALAKRREFSTRLARFSPAQWSELPGWRDDDLADAWRAFLQSCAALGAKPAWKPRCERAKLVGNRPEGIRGFFEHEFSLYEIRNTDGTLHGEITGYYEPLVSGSRTRHGAFVHPVYGEPADMLLLDIRLWPKALRGRAVGARVEGRQVIPIPEGSAPYVVDVGNLAPDDRDKKLRLRLDGRRLVPYFTRAEIERMGLPRAAVLAWVDDPLALYSMQIQGSGKVRLPDGRTLRLAYAEQNGHPFKAPVSGAAVGARNGRITTRGLDIELPGVEEDEPAKESVATKGVATRGTRRPGAPEIVDAEVDAMVERLAANSGSRTAPAAPTGRPRKPQEAHRKAAPPATVPTEVVRFGQATAQALAAISSDPSFVFFRLISDSAAGPLGALGVPLTAGRSVAVDPRSTPLGFPVFLSTARSGARAGLNRLVMAQDTGGAIRGAVRADYFWGFGSEAYAQAARMKENGRMWLLMPNDQAVPARDQPALTRGGPQSAALTECLVEDPDSCVEDR